MRNTILIIALISLTIIGYGQNDIIITVIAPPPHPSLISEFEETAEEYMLTIQNLNPNTTYEVSIHGIFSGDNGIEVSLNEDFVPEAPMTILPLSNNSYTIDELGAFFPPLSLENINYTGGPELEYLIQSQRIPDGVYQVCIEARDFLTDELVSAPMEINCSNPILIESLNPPVITNPLDDSHLEFNVPGIINFNWTNVITQADEIEYEFYLAEVPEGLNVFDAITDQNFQIFSEDNISTPFLIYDDSYPPLNPDTRYAIRVRAIATDNLVHILNDGWSDIIEFRLNDNNISDEEENLFNDNQELDCLAPCQNIEFQIGVPSLNINTGDLVRIGAFDLEIADVLLNGNSYTGNGVIKASRFIPKDLNVNFSNIEINSNNIVTTGIIRALKKERAQSLPDINNMPITEEAESEMIDVLFDELFDPIGESLSTEINEEIEILSESILLPISFGIDDEKIHITDIEFTPQGAHCNMISGFNWLGDFTENSKKLIFNSPNICITPGGIGSDGSPINLNIFSSVDFNPSEVYSIHLNGSNEQNPSYISIDCDGINNITLTGHLSFSSSYIKPIDENFEPYPFGKLAYSFQSEINSWDDMIIDAVSDANLNTAALKHSGKFEVAALPEFSFSIDRVLVDLSESSNADNLVFPSLYNPGLNWTGCYFPEVSLRFPEYFEGNNNGLSTDVSNLIIDDSGVSLGADIQNFIGPDNLSLGGWGLSIGGLNIAIIRNTLISGRINGNIQVPIFENPVRYTAQIRKTQTQLDYDFDIDMREKFEVPMWFAKFKLDNTSRIFARTENNEFIIGAHLNGELELDENVGDWDQVNIKGIRFEDITVQNVAPYIQVDGFDIDAVFNAEFLGFALNLNRISIDNIDIPLRPNQSIPQLGFNLGFKFGDPGLYFNGDTRLLLRGDRNDIHSLYESFETQLEEIEINAEVSSVSVHGHINNYNDHPTYGDGFGGSVTANFIDSFEATADILFGAKENYDYWFINAGFVLPEPAPFLPGIGIHGFNGGAFYNMQQTIADDAPVGQANVSYVPRENGWGFKLGTVWGLNPGASTLNGIAELIVDFEGGNSLGSITLDGMAKMMDSPSYDRRNFGNSEVVMDGVISYDHDNRVLTGSMGYRLDIPRGQGIISGGGLEEDSAIDFLFGGLDDWYLYIGQPLPSGETNRMITANLNLGGNLGGESFNFGSLGLKAYFNIGSEIPGMPPLPPKAAELFSRKKGVISFAGVSRSGIGGGLHFQANIPKLDLALDLPLDWELGIKLGAEAGVGFDFEFAKFNNTLCNGRPNFGINNFYAQGQIYAYFDGWMDWHFGPFSGDLLNCKTAAYLGGGGPNPFYASGKFAFKLDLVVVDYTLRLGFNFGERCQFADSEIEEDIDANEVLAFNIMDDLINANDPQVDFTDQMLFVTAPFTKKPNREFAYVGINGQELTYKYVYNFVLEEYSEQTNEYEILGDKTEILHSVYNNGEVNIFFNIGPDNTRLLKPSKTYRLVARGTIVYRESDNEPWEFLSDSNGEVITDERAYDFETNDLTEYELDILSSYPQIDRQYFHLDDVLNAQATVSISDESWDYLNTLGFGQYAKVKVEIIERIKGLNFVTGDVYNQYATVSPILDNALQFDLSELKGNYNYTVNLYLEYNDVEPRLMNTYSFGTSKHGRLRDKIEQLNIQDIESIGQFVNGPKFNVLIEGDEPFEPEYQKITMEYVNHNIAGIFNLNNNVLGGGNSSSWHGDRSLYIQLAEDMNFISTINFLSPEWSHDLIQNNNINLSPFPNLNLNPQGQNPVLEYSWSPNQFCYSIRTWGINSHFGEIFSNEQYSSLFFTPFESLGSNGNVVFKLSETNSGITKHLHSNL